jgi:uncharacterized protein YjiS (DUF1127 family)
MMTTTLLQRIAAPALPASRLLWRTVAGVVEYLLRCLDRSRQRHVLERLDDAMLRDLGLSRADVMRETDKPFWRD